MGRYANMPDGADCNNMPGQKCRGTSTCTGLGWGGVGKACQKPETALLNKLGAYCGEDEHCITEWCGKTPEHGYDPKKKICQRVKKKGQFCNRNESCISMKCRNQKCQE